MIKPTARVCLEGSQFRDFVGRNPDFDLFAADLAHPDGLTALSLPESNRDALVAGLRAHRRVMQLGAPEPHARALIEAGFDSAHVIGAMPEAQFVEAATALCDGDPEAARGLHRRAHEVKARVRHLYGYVKDTIGAPSFRGTRFQNIDPDLAAYVQGVPSYQDLFGSLDYCACEECRSVFGPAAYFVDVMRVTDQYITRPNTQPAVLPPDRTNYIPPRWSLIERRPDLFTVPLDCANTTTLIPYLQLVDEILEQRLEPELHVSDLYPLLATQVYPWNLPFQLPLRQIRANLSRLNAPLAELYAALEVPVAQPGVHSDAVVREQLGLSVEQALLLTTVDASAAGVAGHYGVTVGAETTLSVLAVFTAQAGLSRSQVHDLLEQNLDADERKNQIGNRFYINATGEGLDPMVIGNVAGVDTIRNTSLARFDRITRFVRLAARLGWSYQDLDCAIRCTGQTELNGAALTGLAGLAQVNAATGLALDVLCSFWGHLDIINRVDAANPQDLFDQVFNNPALLGGVNPYTAIAPPIVPFDPINAAHRLWWVVDDRTGDNATIRSRLRSALQVGDDDLTLIGTYVRWLVPGVGQATPAASLELDLDRLTWLFRLSKWPAMLGITVDELLQLLALMTYPGTPYLNPPIGALAPTPTWIAHLLSTVAWIKASGFSIYELQYVLVPGPLGASRYFDPGYRIADLAPLIEQLATSAIAGRAGPGSFVFEDVTAPESAMVFQALVVRQFVTPLGILRNQKIDTTTLAFLYHVHPDSFVVPGMIDAAASAAAFAALLTHDILITVDADDANVSDAFTAATSLDFLFVAVPIDPDAELKRQQVQAVLLMLQRTAAQRARDTAHTVDVLMGSATAPGLAALQIGTALHGLAALFSTTIELVAALPPIATATGSAIFIYLADLLTPLAGTPVPAAVVTLVAQLSRSLTLARGLQLSTDEVAAIIAHHDAFNISTLSAATFADVHRLATFQRLTASFADNDGKLASYLSMAPDATLSDRVATLAAHRLRVARARGHRAWHRLPNRGGHRAHGPNLHAGHRDGCRYRVHLGAGDVVGSTRDRQRAAQSVDDLDRTGIGYARSAERTLSRQRVRDDLRPSARRVARTTPRRLGPVRAVDVAKNARADVSQATVGLVRVLADRRRDEWLR
jgi:Salmonella virulence plasmid 28.1kDa A protein